MLTQLHWLENLTADPGPFEVSPLLAADIDALNARTLTPSLKTNFEAAAGITLSASFAVYVVKSTEWIIYDPVATAKAYICTQHGTPNNYHLDCQRVMNFYLVEDFHDGDGYCIYSKDWWDIPYVRPRAIRLFGGAGADELPTTEEMNICSTREYDTADGRDYYFTARSGVYQPPIPGPHLILVPIPYDAIVLHGRILRNIAIGPMGVVEDDMGPEGVPNYYQDYDWELEEDVIVSDDFPVVITRPAGCDSMLGYALIYNHSTTHTFPPNYDPATLLLVEELPLAITLDEVPANGMTSRHFSQTTGIDSDATEYIIELDPAAGTPASNIANSVTTLVSIGVQYFFIYGVPSEEGQPNDLRVTQSGALAHLAGRGLRVTQSGAFAHVAGKGLRVTQIGALIRLSATQPSISPSQYGEGEELAWGRYWQLSAEGQSVADVARYGTGNLPVISSTKARTGAYSYRNAAAEAPYNNAAFGFAFLATPTARCHMLFNHNGVAPAPIGGATLVNVLTLDCAGTPISVQWDSATNALQLRAGFVPNTSQPRYPIVTFDAGVFNQANSWLPIGITARIAEVGGFISFYVDRWRMLTWTGDTRIYASGSGTPIAAITGIYATGSPENSESCAGWAAWCYVDDFYADRGDGAEADLPAPFLRFFPRFRCPNTADIKAEMTVVGAPTNGEAIDDGVPDDDESFVGASSSKQDIYPLTDVILDDEWAPTAQIAIGYARKTDNAIDSRVTLGIAQPNTATVSGETKPLTTTYNYVGHRFATAPGNRGWTKETIDATNLAVATDGEFE
jgi:hypothetical protein